MELIWDSEDLKGSAVVFLRSNDYARILVKQARDEFRAKGVCGKQKSQIVAALMGHHEQCEHCGKYFETRKLRLRHNDKCL